MTTQIKVNAKSDISLPSFTATASEQAIREIPSLTGWFEAGFGVEPSNGFRWRDRVSNRNAVLLNTVKPLVVTGSNGKPALQTSYGSASFTGTERGVLRTNSHFNLLSSTGFTVISVTRVPTIASGESATLGGNVWSSYGASANTTPGLNISGVTGKPTFRAGNAIITNPAAFDARTGNWHVIRCVYNGTTDTINLNIDRTRATGTASSATSAPDESIPNMLSPLLGGFLASTGVLSNPFYGQTAAIFFFDSVLDPTHIAAVEDYAASQFGVVLV